MIRGMTGFGHAKFSAPQMEGVFEIKSLNHRYLDIAYYLPVGYAFAEEKIRHLLKQHVERGRVTVSMKILTRPKPTVVFNRDTAKQYLQFSKAIKKELKLQGELALNDIIQLPGVVESKDVVLLPETLWPFLEKGFKKALAHTLAMKKREGQSLSENIKGLIRRMFLQIKKIESRIKVLLREKKKILSEEEFVAFQKSSDIHEEISRLKHHLEEMKLQLRASGSVGKRMDFVAQEMQRETNTIGSKQQDKIVSNAVIALKSKIEKIREQAQNIE